MDQGGGQVVEDRRSEPSQWVLAVLGMEKEEKRSGGLQVRGLSKDVFAASRVGGDCGKSRICRKVSRSSVLILFQSSCLSE